LTGDLHVEAVRQLQGFNLWLDQVDAAGGLKLPDGTRVRFAAKFYDDESKKERVRELYLRLIKTDKARFLLSPYSSDLADAAAVVAQEHRRIMITAGAAWDSTYQKGYTLVYQTYTPASRYLTGTLDLLAHMAPQARKLAIVYAKDRFATGVVRGLKAYADGQGYHTVLFEGFDRGTTDFTPFLRKIPADVDAVMGGGHYLETSAFAKQLWEKGVKAKMVALLVAPPEPRFAQLGEAAVGVIGPSQWEPLAPYSPEAAQAAGRPWVGPPVADFLAAYQARYQEDPSYHSAGGYVAGLILQEAIRQAGSLDTDRVKAALDGLDIFSFFGRLKFDPTPKAHGLQVGHDLLYIQWQEDPEGKLVKQVVWPEGLKTAPAIFYRR
jgi:branched-chain amino acid transport system substrate-binding protein